VSDNHSTLSSQELARIAGVTVRALHIYEAAGLLRPAERTPGGHRRYRRTDLLRLQQILTLKYLGFSLQEIGALLDAEAYDLRGSLAMQKAAIERRIVQLQGVAYALGRTIDGLDASREIDWVQVVLTIRALREAGGHASLERYYPPETRAWLQERAAMTPPELLAQSATAWQRLYATFAERMHLPPEHQDVQELAGEMDRLIGIFTGGNAAIEQGLKAHYQDAPDLLQRYGMTVDSALQAFMQAALAIYRARRGQETP
jgi:DNA-binding transcriptional MerR regulator